MSSFKKYLPEFVREYLRERRRASFIGKAIKLAGKEQHIEAAEIYEDYARVVFEEEDNELSATLYTQYAFEQRLAGKQPDKALEQARETLRLFCLNDGKWLKYDSGDNAKEIVAMVSQLYAAGFPEQGSKLAAEANEEFERHNLPIRCAAEPIRRSEFPAACAQCGGRLPESPFAVAIECPFCHTVIYAENWSE